MSCSLPVEVAVAIISRPDDSFLLTCRPAGKPYAGYWEFPGGKIEVNESPTQALSRELHEELGITVNRAAPWITRTFTYPHATVYLRFYRVTDWQGEPVAREHQQLAWQTADNITVSPLLPANQPILRSLTLPSIYAITHATETGEAQSLQTIEQALQRGVKLLQIREKTMACDQLQRYAQEVLQRARNYQAMALINGNISMAQALCADGVHLPSAQLLSLASRPDVSWCGASCHNEEELYHAEKLGVDFVTVSPVYPTPSHPNSPVLGWKKFAALIRDYSLPAYALGGLLPADLAIAQEQGAHGIALMRGI
jgi:8-oxo-dGTP diphosphatase